MENEDKRLAWFPAPYLEKIDDEDDFDQDEVDGIYGTGKCLETLFVVLLLGKFFQPFLSLKKCIMTDVCCCCARFK